MKTYTWYKGELIEGLGVEEDKILNRWVVVVGEFGRGRRCERVTLARQNPPKIVESRILDAKPEKVTVSLQDGQEKTFFVLERPGSEEEKEKDLIVRVCTYWEYTRFTNGIWSSCMGAPEPEVLARGRGAHGLAGKASSWCDDLIIMREGGALRITPQGGDEKVEDWALWMESGVLRTCIWQLYEQKTALGER